MRPAERADHAPVIQIAVVGLQHLSVALPTIEQTPLLHGKNVGEITPAMPARTFWCFVPCFAIVALPEP